MLWTSVYGAVLDGDDGRFDAVNTIVAILRMRLQHPGLPDEKFAAADAAFADFMACRETAGNAPLHRTPRALWHRSPGIHVPGHGPLMDSSPDDSSSGLLPAAAAGAAMGSLAQLDPAMCYYQLRHHGALGVKEAAESGVEPCVAHDGRHPTTPFGGSIMCPRDVRFLSACLRYN